MQSKTGDTTIFSLGLLLSGGLLILAGLLLFKYGRWFIEQDVRRRKEWGDPKLFVDISQILGPPLVYIAAVLCLLFGTGMIISELSH
jgi:hypothetical protein